MPHLWERRGTGPLFSPCACRALVHGRCLQRWISVRSEVRSQEQQPDNRTCEICRQPYRCREARTAVWDWPHVCRITAHAHVCSAAMLFLVYVWLVLMIATLPLEQQSVTSSDDATGGSQAIPGETGTSHSSHPTGTQTAWYVLVVGCALAGIMTLVTLCTVARRWLDAISDTT